MQCVKDFNSFQEVLKVKEVVERCIDSWNEYSSEIDKKNKAKLLPYS